MTVTRAHAEALVGHSATAALHSSPAVPAAVEVVAVADTIVAPASDLEPGPAVLLSYLAADGPGRCTRRTVAVPLDDLARLDAVELVAS